MVANCRAVHGKVHLETEDEVLERPAREAIAADGVGEGRKLPPRSSLAVIRNGARIAAVKSLAVKSDFARRALG